jgi:hypothetical protein
MDFLHKPMSSFFLKRQGNGIDAKAFPVWAGSIVKYVTKMPATAATANLRAAHEASRPIENKFIRHLERFDGQLNRMIF